MNLETILAEYVTQSLHCRKKDWTSNNLNLILQFLAVVWYNMLVFAVYYTEPILPYEMSFPKSS